MTENHDETAGMTEAELARHSEKMAKKKQAREKIMATKTDEKGLVMGAGQFLGAQAGSRVAMKSGAKIIKPLLVVTSVALAIRLMADPSHPIRVWLGW